MISERKLKELNHGIEIGEIKTPEKMTVKAALIEIGRENGGQLGGLLDG